MKPFEKRAGVVQPLVFPLASDGDFGGSNPGLGNRGANGGLANWAARGTLLIFAAINVALVVIKRREGTPTGAFNCPVPAAWMGLLTSVALLVLDLIS